jgi:hypothetical protein
LWESAMSNHRLLDERILEIARSEPQCDIDESILSAVMSLGMKSGARSFTCCEWGQ